MGTEARALGCNYTSNVCVNLAPNPRWGRLQESWGEDPLLIGTMGAATARGTGRHVMSCVKHFALNSMENRRFNVNVEVPEDVLHECYLPHFRQCLGESDGGASSLMTAYNSVNGEWCGDNASLLGIVRDTWGYEDVLVTSDWLAGTRSAAKGVKAGLDVEMPSPNVRKQIYKALEHGQVGWPDIDRIGKRFLRSLLAYYAKIDVVPMPSAAKVVRSSAHRQLARTSASRSMVLLKNDGILPFSRTTRRLLVIGTLAKSTQTGDDMSSAVRDPDVISPFVGLTSEPDIDVTYLDGKDLVAVQRAAVDADAIFALVGFTGKDEGEGGLPGLDASTIHAIMPALFPYLSVASFVRRAVVTVGKFVMSLGLVPMGSDGGGDRKSLRLRADDEQLISMLAEYYPKKFVLGVEASGPVLLPLSVRERAAAILATGYAGCQFGPALSDVLFGRAEPAGRLAYGMPASELHIPDLDMDNAESVVYGRWWGYRLAQQINVRPTYPFGFGLGYSTFLLASLDVPAELGGRFFRINVEVENIGKHPSFPCIQVYAGKASHRGENDYERVLVGFARTTSPLAPGARNKIGVSCRFDPVAHWDATTRTFVLAQGRYKIWVSRFEGDEEGLELLRDIERVVWGVKAGREGVA